VAGLPRLPAGEAGEEILRGYRANLEDSAARELKTVVIAVDSTEYYYGRRPPSRLWWWSPVVSTHLKVRAFAFPIWMPLAAAAFPAMILWWPQVRSLRSIFRKPKGICRKCGYDLKGLAAGAVCPECGTAPR
jgi:hypothetical protein